MQQFVCKKCLVEQDVSEFYKHRAMKSGHLSFCKTCVIARVADHRQANIERIRAYGRMRGLSPEHKARVRANSPKYNALRDQKAERAKYPVHYAARNALANAIRDGKITKPDACERCARAGLVLHGHHEDYSRPLEVNWLCVDCHGARHREINEERRMLSRVAAE